MEQSGGIESSDIKIPAADQSFYGKTVGEMIDDGAEISPEGVVSGRVKYVTGYTGFSDVAEEQEGYYFPFILEKTGTTMTFKKNNVVVKDNIAWESDNVFRISRGDKFTIEVDGAEVITLDFSSMTFARKA